MSPENMYKNITSAEKISLIAQMYINFPVQKYDKDVSETFVDNKFNGCISFVKLVIKEAGIIIPDFIGLDGVRRPTDHVREFFDHWGVFIPFEKRQKGDVAFFSWNGIMPQHIGIVINANQYIHASTRKGFVSKDEIIVREIEKSDSTSIYSTNPIGIKRALVISQDDPCGSQKPID